MSYHHIYDELFFGCGIFTLYCPNLAAQILLCVMCILVDYLAQYFLEEFRLIKAISRIEQKLTLVSNRVLVNTGFRVSQTITGHAYK